MAITRPGLFGVGVKRLLRTHALTAAALVASVPALGAPR